MKPLHFLIKPLAVVALFFALFSCSEQKKIQRAQQRVLLDPASFDQVGRKWLDLHPCLNDSSITFLPGGVDSIGYPVPVLDSIGLAMAIDSMEKALSKAEAAAYAQGYRDAFRKVAETKVPAKRPDTLLASIKDQQQRKLDAEQIAKLIGLNKYWEGKTAQMSEELNGVKDDRSKWIWLFIVACIALAGSNFLWIYSRIKKF